MPLSNELVVAEASGGFWAASPSRCCAGRDPGYAQLVCMHPLPFSGVISSWNCSFSSKPSQCSYAFEGTRRIRFRAWSNTSGLSMIQQGSKVFVVPSKSEVHSNYQKQPVVCSLSLIDICISDWSAQISSPCLDCGLVHQLRTSPLYSNINRSNLHHHCILLKDSHQNVAYFSSAATRASFPDLYRPYLPKHTLVQSSSHANPHPTRHSPLHIMVCSAGARIANSQYPHNLHKTHPSPLL
ncbi:hypothetical protein BJ508DRAFT_135650 [Ascobolus immersus RN42]|uniref:Uncharacterized protein n=1 Tax=Ascobolus immersus RN42 TaxID=1160509 RepID=A0A3N4IY28_ASCIM|nr:hypothetical protein BJ508DRAFT_135650 [Ascobolus immersus RN42]